MSKSEAGKGDSPRPCNRKKWDENYDRIFGKKPMTIKEKVEQGDIHLTEILNEMGEGSVFCTDKFMVDRQNQMVLVVFVDITSSAYIDWKEPMSKSLVCERLLDAHRDISKLTQQNVDRLQQIRNKISG